MNKRKTEVSRRTFLRAAVACAAAGAPAVLAPRSPAGLIGVGCIDVGTQGHSLLREAQKIPNVEIRVICDLYEGHLKRAQELCTNPRARRQRRALQPQDAVVSPDYSMTSGEFQVSSHIEDFFDCVRTRTLPRCPVDRAFEEAVAILMSVEAYKRKRRVRWDPAKEQIV